MNRTISCAMVALLAVAGYSGCRQGSEAGKAREVLRVEWETLLREPDKFAGKVIDIAGVMKFADETMEFAPAPGESPLPIWFSYAIFPEAENGPRGFDQLKDAVGRYEPGQARWVQARVVGVFNYQSPKDGRPKFGHLAAYRGELVLERVLTATKVGESRWQPPLPAGGPSEAKTPEPRSGN